MPPAGELQRDPEAGYEALMIRRNAPRQLGMMMWCGIDPETA